MPQVPQRIPYLALLSNPVTGLIWLGQLTSAAGSQLHHMAMLWLVYAATESSTAVSGVALATYLPVAVVGLLGGSLIDRWHRLRTLLTLDLIRALLVGLLPLLYWRGWLTPWALAGSGLVLSTLDALFVPTLQAALPSLVTPVHLQSINGLMDTTHRLARLLGPGTAGLILSLVPLVHFFTLDALSFALSALAFWLVLRRVETTARVRAADPGDGATASVAIRLRSSLQGWSWIRSDAFLRTALTVRGLCNVAWGLYSVGAPVLVARKFSGDPGAWGLIIAAYGAANLVGNLLVGNLGRPQPDRPPLLLYLLAWAFNGLGFIGIGLAPHLELAAAGAFVAGVSSPAVHILLDSYIAATVPQDRLGRLFALQQMVVHGMGALGLALAGWLLLYLEPDQGLLLAGGFMVAVAGGAALPRAFPPRHTGGSQRGGRPRSLVTGERL